MGAVTGGAAVLGDAGGFMDGNPIMVRAGGRGGAAIGGAGSPGAGGGVAPVRAAGVTPEARGAAGIIGGRGAEGEAGAGVGTGSERALGCRVAQLVGLGPAAGTRSMVISP